MSRWFIIGAGGFGREVLSWLRQSPELMSGSESISFLDDNPRALEGYNTGVSLAGSPGNVEVRTGDKFVCAIGDPRTRLELCRALRSRGAEFPVVRHPMTVVGENCRIGIGCILCPGVVVTANVVLGDFIVLNAQATVGHDARLGDGVTLSGHVDITGFARVGEGVFFGSHAVVLPRSEVGDYSRVGAGSVVLRRVKAGATVMGVPAKQISP